MTRPGESLQPHTGTMLVTAMAVLGRDAAQTAVGISSIAGICMTATHSSHTPIRRPSLLELIAAVSALPRPLISMGMGDQPPLSLGACLVVSPVCLALGLPNKQSAAASLVSFCLARMGGGKSALLGFTASARSNPAHPVASYHKPWNLPASLYATSASSS